MMRKCVRTSVILMLPLFLCPQKASAHRDDYLNETIVYLTLERGELEAEYWFDRGWRSDDGGNFIRHNTAVEWGITNHWMLDGRVTAISDKVTNFDSGRLETRYRFSDEGVQPVDIAASFEVNTEREAGGSTIVGIEPRVIVSKDIGEPLNFTANFSEEILLDSGASASLVALGSRFNWTSLVRVGSEFQYNLNQHFGSVIPQLWFALPRDVTVKMGYSLGTGQQREDFARIALEVEF